MKREYLGDSYDLVKRLWHDLLSEWAPLYANSAFIPEDLREDYTRITGISMLTENPRNGFSILNDPDVGIRLPSERNQAEGRTHIAVGSIIEQLKSTSARCVITFDQAVYRNHRLKPREQLQIKIKHLADNRYPAFYYRSHAPFLFAVRDRQTLQELRQVLTERGIPAERLEDLRERTGRGSGPTSHALGDRG